MKTHEDIEEEIKRIEPMKDEATDEGIMWSLKVWIMALEWVLDKETKIEKQK